MDEHIKQLYDITTRAVNAHTSMRDAVARGTVDQYHKVLRETPEVKLVSPLTAVRRRLSELSSQRRRAMNEVITLTGVHAVRRQIDVDEMTKAMSAMAHGTMMWTNEQLGRPTVPSPAPPPAPPATTVPTDDALMNSGEEL